MVNAASAVSTSVDSRGDMHRRQQRRNTGPGAYIDCGGCEPARVFALARAVRRDARFDLIAGSVDRRPLLLITRAD